MREQNQAHIGQARSNLFGCLYAVHFGHLDVQQHHIRPQPQCRFHRRFTIAHSLHHGNARHFAQGLHVSVTQNRLVFGNQHLNRRHSVLSFDL